MLPLYRTGALPFKSPGTTSRLRPRRSIVIVVVVFLCFMAYVMLLRAVTNQETSESSPQSPQTQLLDELQLRQHELPRDNLFDQANPAPNDDRRRRRTGTVLENNNNNNNNKQNGDDTPPHSRENGNDPHRLDGDGAAGGGGDDGGGGGGGGAFEPDVEKHEQQQQQQQQHEEEQQERVRPPPLVKQEAWRAAEIEADKVRKQQEADGDANPVRIGADFDNKPDADEDDTAETKKLEGGFEAPMNEKGNGQTPKTEIGDYSTTRSRWARRDLSAVERAESESRRREVVDAFVHAWSGYEKYAWGFDELMPLSRKGKNWVSGGIGMTIIDALDTMILMNLQPQIKRARDWISTSLDFARDAGISVFETTIRDLGGLLSAFALTNDKLYLEKAVDLADRLSWAFETQTGIPYTTINLKTHRGSNPGWSGHASILSEIGTLQLEFRYLSHVTGNNEYNRKVTRIMETIESHLPEDGLAPVYIDEKTGEFRGSSKVTLGALGDSYFEYLIKQWLLTGKTDERYRRMYDKAISSIASRMVGRSDPSGLVFVGELEHGSLRPKMDHLACFVAGMLVLGAEGKNFDRHRKLAEDLTYTCYQMYARQPTGIAPEVVTFQPGRDMVASAEFYILRPETIEALFYMWRATKDKKYRDWGWEIFQAIQKHCKVEGGGYAGLKSVSSDKPAKDDLMQSFFLAETLKYLFLLFSPDDVLDLDKWIFNTEAHPLPVFSSSP